MYQNTINTYIPMTNKQAPKVVGIQNRSVLYEAPPAALVPEGVYSAELIDVRRFTNSFGDRVGLVFKIDKGAHAVVVARHEPVHG